MVGEQHRRNLFALDLVLLSPAVLARWTANGPSDGTVLGMTVPVLQSLMNMTLLIAALARVKR
jgi:hypothetical protein